MKLTDPATIRALLGDERTSFKKKFGQNFLISENTVCRIASECLPGDGKSCGILEIGPGIGTLTCELASVAKKVVTVEIDSSLLPILDKTLAEHDNVTVINADVLKLDLPALISRHFADCEHVAVAANLPYYITTPILMLLLESELPIDAVTVMVQKEVAARLCSSPSDPEYGAVTAAVTYYASVKKLFGVSAGCFLPAPKVDSAVVRLDIYKEPPLYLKDKALFFSVIKAAFMQRRKTLLNALAAGIPGLSKEAASAAIAAAGLSQTVRGEALGNDSFAHLANILYDSEAIR